jgi:hypothetical protein
MPHLHAVHSWQRAAGTLQPLSWQYISTALHTLSKQFSSVTCAALHHACAACVQIMWDNGHHASPIFIIAFYGFCHLCTAATMFKELDMREAGDTYFAVSAAACIQTV